MSRALTTTRCQERNPNTDCGAETRTRPGALPSDSRCLQGDTEKCFPPVLGISHQSIPKSLHKSKFRLHSCPARLAYSGVMHCLLQCTPGGVGWRQCITSTTDPDSSQSHSNSSQPIFAPYLVPQSLAQGQQDAEPKAVVVVGSDSQVEVALAVS